MYSASLQEHWSKLETMLGLTTAAEKEGNKQYDQLCTSGSTSGKASQTLNELEERDRASFCLAQYAILNV